jgi:hypothetical protein
MVCMSLFITHLLRPVMFEEGRLQEARRILLDLGTERLGEPDDAVRDRIENTYEVRALERMVLSLLTASSWQEVQTAASGR